MAVDHIAILFPKTHVKEGSAFTVTVYNRNRSTSAAATPTSFKYRLDCLSTETELLAWTTLSPSSSASIAITGAQNAIQSDSNDFEWKQLSIMTDEGLPTQYREIKVYTVENLYGSP